MNITAIAIVAIVATMITTIVKLSTKFVEKNRAAPKELDALKEEISELKTRVATLESIVTDSKYDLHRKFEQL